MLSAALKAAGGVRQVVHRWFSTTAAAKRPTTEVVHTASSTQEAIARLRSQPAHYVVASVVGRKYILAPRDLLTVARLKDVRVGDRLRLSEIHEVGSRDYTLRGSPTLPHGLINVEATVIEHTKGALERIVKFKKRKHYKKTITHKQPYTRLRIGPIELGSSQTADQQTAKLALSPP